MRGWFSSLVLTSIPIFYLSNYKMPIGGLEADGENTKALEWGFKFFKDFLGREGWGVESGGWRRCSFPTYYFQRVLVKFP